MGCNGAAQCGSTDFLVVVVKFARGVSGSSAVAGDRRHFTRDCTVIERTCVYARGACRSIPFQSYEVISTLSVAAVLNLSKMFGRLESTEMLKY